VEDDVDVLRYAILELHARNDDCKMHTLHQTCLLYVSALNMSVGTVVVGRVAIELASHYRGLHSGRCLKFGIYIISLSQHGIRCDDRGGGGEKQTFCPSSTLRVWLKSRLM